MGLTPGERTHLDNRFAIHDAIDRATFSLEHPNQALFCTCVDQLEASASTIECCCPHCLDPFVALESIPAASEAVISLDLCCTSSSETHTKYTRLLPSSLDAQPT
ncbi:hypothetical protein PsorP6_000746 [Peronosclerospora sorghi]|uniref:Uncharacterized protein n=1 Tax=Peronosclerospora sorghi TaxID=230839 RepID=A0ACC0WYE7_9STRA|nr:hypothetical protein PsorP6_000746 [Peronosclerospora sorghi]